MKYPSLPVMQCDDGCGECCGPVFCRTNERQAVEAYAAANNIQPLRQGISCPWYQGGACSVHPVRPWICRYFGHTPTLVCCKGYNRNVTPERQAALDEWYRPDSATECLHEVCYSFDEIVDVLKDYAASASKEGT